MEKEAVPVSAEAQKFHSLSPVDCHFDLADNGSPAKDLLDVLGKGPVVSQRCVRAVGRENVARKLSHVETDAV